MLIGSLSKGLIYGLTWGIIIGLTAGLNKEIKPVETIEWSGEKIKRTSKRICKRGLKIRLILGLIAGPFIGLLGVGGLTGNLIYRLIMGLIAGPIVGMFYGLWFGLLIGAILGLIGSENKTRTVPNQGIRESAKNAVILSFISGFIWVVCWFALLFLLWKLPNQSQHILNLIDAFIILFFHGACLGFIVGGSLACIQHFALRLIL